jgi:hypothetical protein
MSHPPPTPVPPVLLARIEDLRASGVLPRGAVLQLHIGHDRWCGHFRGQPCTCAPEFTLIVHRPDHPPYEVTL